MSRLPPGQDEREEQERRTLINLLAAVVLLALAIAAVWLLRYIDERRKIEACLEAARNDCLRRYDPAAQ